MAVRLSSLMECNCVAIPIQSSHDRDRLLFGCTKKNTGCIVVPLSHGFPRHPSACSSQFPTEPSLQHSGSYCWATRCTTCTSSSNATRGSGGWVGAVLSIPASTGYTNPFMAPYRPHYNDNLKVYLLYPEKYEMWHVG
jgi:hypothetical protein